MRPAQLLRPFVSVFTGMQVCLCSGFEASNTSASNVVAGVECIAPDAKTGSSTAVVVDEVPLVHTTQLLPLDSLGTLVGQGDAARQTEAVLSNLSLVLNAAGSDLAHTVKLNLYLTGSTALPRAQSVLARAFAGRVKPAVCVEVGDLPLSNVLVAMDAVATLLPSDTNKVVKQFASARIYQLEGIAQAALLPSGPKVYVSGMADTNSLPVATGKTLEKLVAAIGHLDLKKTDIVQLKAFLQPISEANVVREKIVSFFEGKAPPLVFVDWISSGPSPPIEIELIAVAKGDSNSEPDSVSFLTPPGTSSTKVFSRVARVNRGKLIYFSGLCGTKSQGAGDQIREIFRSMGAVLQQSGSDFGHLVKATYYVSDDEASNSLNDIRPEFYDPQRPPAASKAKVRDVGMAGKNIAMDMIAVTR